MNPVHTDNPWLHVLLIAIFAISAPMMWLTIQSFMKGKEG
jgi:hypothetical protein